MNAIGWGGKTLEQVGDRPGIYSLMSHMLYSRCYAHILFTFSYMFQVYEDVSQCCQALSQRLGTQPFFFNKQYVSVCLLLFKCTIRNY